MKTLQAAFLIVICLLGYGENSIYDDYCWRDYDGEVPSDAIIGGVDTQGRPIYIGQVVYDSMLLLPGKILTGDKNCYVIYNEKEHAVNDSVQILCSKRPDKFEWLPVFYNQINQLRNTRALEAGYEKGFETYIGRVRSENEITVSKVTCWAFDCDKMPAMVNGEMRQYELFDVLVYNMEYQDKE